MLDYCYMSSRYYLSFLARAHPAISHMLLKCRVATNISHWLKVQSRWFKNYIIICEKVYFDQLLDFQILLLLFLHTCHIYSLQYFTLWMLDFFNTIRVSNSLDPNQARHFDLGPYCLQRLSAANGPLADQELNTIQLVDTSTFWLNPWLKLISFGFQLFPFG